MGKEFVPYELALKLRELGFSEPCFGYWLAPNDTFLKEDLILSFIQGKNNKDNGCFAPLWQQIFDWFHKEHNLFAEFSFNTLRSKYDWCIPVNINKGYCSQEEYDTYEEARLECLKKLIKIIENEKL